VEHHLPSPPPRVKTDRATLCAVALEPTIETVHAVRPAVAGRVRRTPLLRSEELSSLSGGEVLLKCENLQVTGSFKVRGAVAAVWLDRPTAVTAASAGNHGLGLAFAARETGVDCTIVVPRTVPKVKEDAIRALGARLVKAPHDGYDDTQTWALDNLDRLGGSWISPFDHPGVIAGNGGTTALEVFEEAPELDAVVVPCGGGGCAIGVGIVARNLSPRTRVIGVNTSASPGMWLSRRDGNPHLRIESEATIAEGIEGGVSPTSYELANRFIDEILVVPEDEIRKAVGWVARHARLIVEGSAAAGVAAILGGLVPQGRVSVILTGGNIDLDRLIRLL
jgi:threonine dehydratase